jgi:hypothetical protein
MDQLLDIAANSDTPLPDLFSEDEGSTPNEAGSLAPSRLSSLTPEEEEEYGSSAQGSYPPEGLKRLREVSSQDELHSQADDSRNSPKTIHLKQSGNGSTECS